MLRFLRIQHLAIIDSVEIEFDPGFNVLTGETGAGKSILVEAVGLLLGGRASADLVRTGEESAAVEAIFDSRGDEMIVRREITAQGRSRAFVNGALATATALKDLSGRMIELHGQHEHQTLLDLLEPGRRRFDAVGVAAQEHREILELRLDPLTRIDVRLELRIEARQLRHAPPDAAQRRQDRIVALVQ